MIDDDDIVEIATENRKRPADMKKAAENSDDDFEIIEMPPVTKKPKLSDPVSAAATAMVDSDDDEIVCLD